MASLQAGDVMVVTKLDRLGRSTRQLLGLIERIGKVGASFRSLGDPLWDTGSSQGRLLSTMLAAIAEFERELIRERTGEGRKRAQAAGVRFGRKRKLSDFQRANGWHGAKDLKAPGNISLLPLPPRSPELNPQENIWQFMRANWLSNRVFKSFDDIQAILLSGPASYSAARLPSAVLSETLQVAAAVLSAMPRAIRTARMRKPLIF
jgi:transposase